MTPMMRRVLDSPWWWGFMALVNLAGFVSALVHREWGWASCSFVAMTVCAYEAGVTS